MTTRPTRQPAHPARVTVTGDSMTTGLLPGRYQLAGAIIPAEAGPYSPVNANIVQADDNDGAKAGALPLLRLAVNGPHVSAYTDEREQTAVQLPRAAMGTVEPLPAVPYAQLFGVPYSLIIRLEDYGDGYGLQREKAEQPASTWYAVTGRRHDSNPFGIGELTDAARKYAREVVTPALLAWLRSEEAAPILSAGRAHWRAYQIANAEKHAEEARQVFEAATAEIVAARALPSE